MIGGRSTLEMIDDVIRAYKDGVAKIDKNYLILIMNKVHNHVYLLYVNNLLVIIK